MKISLLKFVIFIGLCGSMPAKASIWQESQNWNPEWEQKYSDWISTSFNEDFFTRGPYKDIETDCADAVYNARIIFAFENKLPFAIKDPTGGPQMITNQMSRFDSIKDPHARLRKFMGWLEDVVSTKSLANDTYPVAVHRNYIRAGTVWSRPRITRDNIFSRIFGGTVKEDPGHAELVKNVSETGAIFLIGSTVPKAVRNLNTTSSLVFMPVETSTGFRNWLQPLHYNAPMSEIPGYSLEQFSSIGKVQAQQNSESYAQSTQRNLSTWTADVQNHLAMRPESKGENIARQLANLCNLVNTRVGIILKAEEIRLAHGGACMNAADYDAYSTPSRDKRIMTTLEQLIDVGGGFGFTKKQRIKDLESAFAHCPDIQYSPGKFISLYSYSIKALSGDISSNPNENVETRWGFAPANSNCPQYE